MKLVELNQAISEINQAWDDSDQNPRHSPYFLVVGAGVSFPPVPLAFSIIEHCKTTAQQYRRVSSSSASNSVLDTYSDWFSLAYPHPRQRQKYFQRLIDRQPISLANLRLAHLLSAKKLTNLVITTNFDDFLPKALRLFGQTPAVCDHPSTVARIDLEGDDIQIVHVHGSYLFYDCANLRGEVAGRAQFDRDSSLTMVGLLDNVLWHRSPIVVGYSGWEGDVIMSALKRRLCGGHPMGHNIYWCCYKRDVPEQMPNWLKDNPQVQFIVPPEKVAAVTEGTATRVAGETSPAEAAIRREDSSPTLSAREVFERFNEALDAEIPSLLLDPLNFLANHLESSLPKDESIEGGSDPYGLKKLIERIREAAKLQTPQVKPEIAEKLETITTAIQQSRYDEAIRAMVHFVPYRLGQLNADQRKEVLNAAVLAGDALLAKQRVEANLIKPLGQVLSVDPRLVEHVGTLANGVIIVFASRPGQTPLDALIEGQPRGTFSASFETAWQSAWEGQRARKLHEIVIQANALMLKKGFMQCSVVVGEGLAFSLPTQRKKPAAKLTKGKWIALLVGINKYKNFGTNLAGCVNDVRAMEKLLRKREDLIDLRQVKTLIDSKATAAAIEEQLKRVAQKSQAGDTLYFHFSGHLTTRTEDNKSQSTLLIAHDYNEKGDGCLSLATVLKAVESAKAKFKILVLD